MARGRKATHICESCNKPIEITRWEYINSRQDQDKLPLLRNFHLFNNFCPHCGERTYPDICLLYQDVENKVIIYYIDGQNKEVKKQEVLETIEKKPLSGYSYRVITDRVTFVQKVEMLLCGYDDRILELAKWLTFMIALDINTDMEAENIWFELDEEDNAVWNISYPEEYHRTVEITPEMYAEYVDTFSDILDAADEQEICANEDWAAEAIQILWEQYEQEMEQEK